MKTNLDNPLLTAPSQAVTDQKTFKDRAALKKSCQAFEAIFIQSMFKSMRKTVPEGGLFEKDHATEMYQDMIDQELATQISQRQSLGLADQMYRQMEKLIAPKK
ncbi:MAG: rod-binding protein [Desulfobulbus sp.]|nr:rod-binding protein [Desulfobulbus sp.]